MIGWRAVQGFDGGQLAAILLAGVLPLLLLSPASLAQEAGSAEIPLRIAAGPASEPMFGLAGIVANIVSNPPGGPPCSAGRVCGYPGLIGEARSTTGSRANLESLAAGQSETAIVEADLLWQAYNGFGLYAGKPLGDLRALSVLYTESVMLVVRASSPIAGIADLRGRTVAIGPLDDPHLHTMRQILAGHGVRERDMTQIQLSAEAAADALAYGDIDAALVVAPSLPQAYRDVAERRPLRLLPVDRAVVAPLLERHPYLLEVEIGDLAEGRRTTPGLALAVLWVGTQQLPAAVGYGLVRSLQAPANADTLAQARPTSSAMATEKELTRSPIPLHPGAARWFEEQSGVVR